MLKRICRLLLPDERKMGIRVVCAVFLCALLDFAGLAALLPVLFFLLDDGRDKDAALLFCLVAIVFILVKNALAAGLSRFQNHFLMSLYRRLSFSLFTSYYQRGLLFIRSRGSIRLGYEVNYICYAFSLNLLSPLLRMTGELLLVFWVTAALLVYAPLTVLMLYIAFLPFMLIYGWGIRKPMRRYGEQEQQARREQSRLVTETMKGYAELELNAAFPFLQQAFAQKVRKISESRLKLETIQHLPLCLSEMAVISGLTLLTVFGTGDIKALVGVFALAAFRLLPALRGILGGWTQVQNAVYSLRIIEEGLGDKGMEAVSPSWGQEAFSFQKEIRIEHLTYAYPESKEVLKDFCCTIRKGEYVGICGESGVGKSTLFNLLLGFITPDKGAIRIDGRPLADVPRQEWHRKVGYVQQEVFVLDGTLAENIALGCRSIDKERVAEIVRLVRLDAWMDELPQGMDTPLGEGGGRLSGGQKQRVGIARALYKKAEVLRKYSINSLVYWVTYVHNVVYSFYRSMIYCYINSTQRCAGSIVIDIIPTNGADKRKFFPFAPYFPVTNVIKRYFYPYFPAIIGIKGYSFPYFPYLSGIMKIKTALYSLFSRLDWHKTVVFPCLGEIYEGIRSLSWEIPVT